jgi:hypothetical protein
MGLITVLAAAEEAGRSEAPFFIVGGLLAAFAVLISALGFTRPDFPGTATAQRAAIGTGATLVVLTMAMGVYIAS